jgi:phosphonate ABC transporter permease subunit PhnE
MKKSRSLGRSIGLGLAVFAGLMVYAYGFQVTKVNLEETRSERRQTQLIRILRALAHPDLVEYEQDEFEVNAPILLGCPAGGVDFPEPDTSGPYMILDPPCADPKGEVMVEGFNFQPNTRGPISFIPPSEVTLQLGNIEADETGHFQITVKLPNRTPIEDVQYIRAVTRRNVGGPLLTRTAYDTWDKIVETVFMALLATTIGTALAIPISFFAARNLMKDVSSPIVSVALSILAWPIGIYLGAGAARWVGEMSQLLTGSVPLTLGGMVAGPLLIWGTTRFALPQVDEGPDTLARRVARMVSLLAAALVGILTLYLISNLVISFGDVLGGALGVFGFVGTFIADLGDILGTLIVTLSAVAGGAVLSNIFGRLGALAAIRLSPEIVKVLNILLAGLAGAALFALLGSAIDWFYQFGDPLLTFWGPAVVGAVAGLALAITRRAESEIPVGLVVYFTGRTILNTLRSIEPLIMVIVFAVWVGIGPFAGVLALALHTIAALAKLYSEQVESILPGPLEAVKAAGATRLQTIIYAVIPQIVPPYIAFTMYRWDINVRMSTIIGFAGGGGIGFLLQQNINLLNYRAAAAQMFAIAIVVASMDYLSSRLREGIV